MKKQLLFSEDARKKMLRGVEQISEAVKVTLGPKGRLVMLDRDYAGPIITKDGVSVARAIELKDPFENMGAKLLKEVSSKTNDIAGDGTTTATVLAYSMVKEGLKSVTAGIPPIEIKRGMDKAVDQAVDYVKKSAKSVKDEEEVKHVATISANNDAELGGLLATAFAKVGKDGVITVEESKSMETTTEFVEGMQLEGGYVSSYFVTDRDRMTVNFEDPYILIYTGKIISGDSIIPVLEKVCDTKRPLVIMCEDIEGEALTTLILNNLHGSVKTAAIKAPSYGEKRKEIMQDLAILSGGIVVDEDMGAELETVSLEQLGTVKSVKITKDDATFVGTSNEKGVKSREKEIKAQIENAETEYEKKQLRDRYAKFTGGVAVVKVGAVTEVEMKEKKHRVEDTLAATRAAIEEGIVAGGGLTLIEAAEHLDPSELNLTDAELVGFKIVKRALEEPIRQIAINAGLDGSVIADKAKNSNKGVGFDAYAMEWKNLMEAGIVDPAKVTRTALQNASSVAGLLLTTECAVTDIPEETKQAPIGAKPFNY